jgi:hypothetical protein
VLQYYSLVAVAAAVGRAGVETVSFPLAPAASGKVASISRYSEV